MNKIDKIKNHFIEYGGVLKTSELNDLGFSSRQIKKKPSCQSNDMNKSLQLKKQ